MTDASPTAIRIATRKSPLAMAQATLVADALTQSTGRESVLVAVSSAGDETPESLTSIGGAGVFVGAVRDALLGGLADIGVHSFKDLPTQEHPELEVVATPERESATDVLCGPGVISSLSDLPAKARVGTGSPRRAAQLRYARPDLDVVDIRGNVATRLKKIQSGDVDAVVLARAGLSRLDMLDAVSCDLDTEVMVPAPGQGALAIEAPRDLGQRDAGLRNALNELNHDETYAATQAERALLARLQAGCSSPVGALANIANSGDNSSEPTITLQAVVASPDGSQVLRKSITGRISSAVKIGEQLADEFIADDAAGLLGELSK